MTAEPTYATRPNPDAPHDLPALMRTARLIGKDLIPWQRLAGRLMTERSILEPNRYRYRTVIITVPRQAGKTVLVGCELCRRTIAQPNRQAWYTAQTGKDARERWGDLRELVQSSPIANHASVALRAGAETIAWPNGSFIRAFAPTVSSLHGYTPDTVAVDEAWKYTQQQGSDLMGAIVPAQITLPHRQLLVFSTMGSADSMFWHAMVEAGRASIQDPDSDVAYVEYSLPDGADLYDPKVWPLFHPGYGYRVTEADLSEAAEKLPRGEFARAIGNIRTAALETLVPMEQWEPLTDTTLRPAGRRTVLAYDVAHDRSRAAIVAAWQGDHGGPAVRVVYSAPGISWLPEVLKELRPTVDTIAADDGGLTRDATDAVRRAGVEVELLGGRDYTTATASILGHIKDGTLRHDGSAGLTQSIENAATRPMGDSIGLSRRQSRGPIPELVAAAVAIRVLENAAAPAPKPYLVVSA